MLASDEKLILTGAAAQVAAPTADQPPLEAELAPADHVVFKLGHESPLLVAQ
jgi:hypothetical protein